MNLVYLGILVLIVLYFIRKYLEFTRIDLNSKKAMTVNPPKFPQSQFGQDIWIINKYQFKKNGYYIDIGANNGKQLSNTYLLDTEYEWNGVCIDPILHNMGERSCDQYKGLVSNKIEEVDFIFSTDPGGALSGISGKNTAYVNSPFVLNGRPGKLKTEITQNVFNKFKVPRYVDYLSLDVEGSEMMVLEGIDFDKHRFGIISIEHNHQQTMKENIARFLIPKGYQYETTLGVDDIYTLKELFT